MSEQHPDEEALERACSFIDRCIYASPDDLPVGYAYEYASTRYARGTPEYGAAYREAFQWAADGKPLTLETLKSLGVVKTEGSRRLHR